MLAQRLLDADPLHHLRTQHANADGYVTLAKKENGKFKQRLYKAESVEKQLSEWLGEDVYFSQNTFFKPRRTVDAIRQLRSVFVDIDCYLLNYTPEWTLGKIESELFQQSVPEPNIIIFSGRGLNCIWLIEPEPYMALPRWQAVQSYLNKQFQQSSIGADPKACDAARVFRLAGTTNSKASEIVHVQYRHNNKYTLYEIQQEYLPELEPKKETKKKGRPSKNANLFNTYSLNWARLQDLMKLVEMRSYNVKGLREIICFLYRYWSCCFVGNPEEALRQTLEFNSEFTRPLKEKEVITATRSAEKAFNGKVKYNYSNQKLIEILEISEDEQRHLKTIIGKSERNRRKRKANESMRRSEGMATREVYLSEQYTQTEDRLQQLREALTENPKAKRQELADKLSLSVHRIDQLKRMLKSL